MTDATPTKRCYTCGRDRELWHFHRDRIRKDGLSQHCMDCARAATKRSRERHKGVLVTSLYDDGPSMADVHRAEERDRRVTEAAWERLRLAREECGR